MSFIADFTRELEITCKKFAELEVHYRKLETKEKRLLNKASTAQNGDLIPHHEKYVARYGKEKTFYMLFLKHLNYIKSVVERTKNKKDMRNHLQEFVRKFEKDAAERELSEELELPIATSKSGGAKGKGKKRKSSRVNSVDSTSSGKESTTNSTVHISQKSSTSSPTSVSGNMNSTTTVSASAVSSTGISQNLRSNSYIEASKTKNNNNSIDKVVNNTKVNSVHHNDSHTVIQAFNVPAQVTPVNQKAPAKAKRGVKRKADTTTPSAISKVEPEIITPPVHPSQPATKVAKVSTRRKSGRPIKKPSKDLPETPSIKCEAKERKNDKTNEIL